MPVVPNTTEVDPTHNEQATPWIQLRMKRPRVRIVSHLMVSESMATQTRNRSMEMDARAGTRILVRARCTQEKKKENAVFPLLGRMRAHAST